MFKEGCRAIVFRCFDYRLTFSRVAGLLKSAGYEEADYNVVSLAGSLKSLVAGEAVEKEFIFRQIDLSVAFHGISEIVILYHDTCRAYGIDDLQMEDLAQRSDLHLILMMLTERYPALKSSAFMIKGTGEREPRLVKVS